MWRRRRPGAPTGELCRVLLPVLETSADVSTANHSESLTAPEGTSADVTSPAVAALARIAERVAARASTRQDIRDVWQDAVRGRGRATRERTSAAVEEVADAGVGRARRIVRGAGAS